MATIVVLEDDRIVRAVVTRMLEMNGYTVQAFEDAKPALDTVDFEQVDLLITDLLMPTPGERAVRILRKRDVPVPVLVMSGHLTAANRAALEALGVRTFLTKPFKLTVLLEAVRSLMKACDAG